MVTHVPLFAIWYSFHESCRERPGTDGSSSIVTRQGHVVAMHADFFFFERKSSTLSSKEIQRGRAYYADLLSTVLQVYSTVLHRFARSIGE